MLDSQKEHKRKKVGYYEVESINNPGTLTIALKPKEYYELFENTKLNNKHKGIEKGSTGFSFEKFSQRLGSLVNFDNFGKPPPDS